MLAATGVLDGWLDKNASEFHDALATSDVERVLMLAEDRKTPKKLMLHTACMTGGSNGTDVALALVASGGFDVDSRNTSGFTALTWTAIRGDTKTARALLKADADPNVIDDQGFTPLGWAATNGFLEVARELLMYGAEVDLVGDGGNTALCWACASGHADVVTMLLDEGGADMNISNARGEVPLLLAFSHGHDAVARILISRGADVNAGSAAPLHWAAVNGFIDVAQELVACGGDVNGRSHDGYTPLYSACRRGSLELVTLLLEHGADASARVHNDARTALHTATVNGFLPGVKLLLAAGADIDAKSTTGYTPLHFAFKKNRRDGGEIARLLVQRGADVHTPTAAGLGGVTPLSMSNEESGERAALIDLSERQGRWQRRKSAVMTLAAAGVLPGMRTPKGAALAKIAWDDTECANDTELSTDEEEDAAHELQKGMSEAGQLVYTLLHRQIVSFL